MGRAPEVKFYCWTHSQAQNLSSVIKTNHDTLASVAHESVGQVAGSVNDTTDKCAQGVEEQVGQDKCAQGVEEKVSLHDFC